jgi:transmembrane sensor
MTDPNRLTPYVKPPRLEARLQGQWENIAGRRARKPKGWFVPALAVTTLFLVLVAARYALQTQAPSGWLEGSAVETAARGGQVGMLPDGSVVVLSAATRLEVTTLNPRAVKLSLLRGGVSLDVTHVEGREFKVLAYGAEVTVRGTAFRVELEPELKVLVQRGRVEVRLPSGEQRELNANEAWSTGLTGSASVGVPEEELEEDPPVPAAASEASTAQRSATQAQRFSELLKAHRPKEAYAALGPNGFARELSTAGPKRLLELADVARMTGRPRESASAFDALRKKFRTDPRAGLAALELGRLRLDSFGDPAGAEEALADAIALSPTGPFVEDARARRVQALDELGATERCRVAKDDYLRRYPEGVHSASLASRCAQ